jgi:hypothetical protein
MRRAIPRFRMWYKFSSHVSTTNVTPTLGTSFVETPVFDCSFHTLHDRAEHRLVGAVSL